MKRYSVVLTLLVLLSGCSKEQALSEMVLVYESRNALQCESSGIAPSASAAKLTAIDIDVNETYCGRKTGVAYPAACGMGNGDIVIHKISAKNAIAAQKVGFQTVSTLISIEQGTDYDTVECEVVE